MQSANCRPGYTIYNEHCSCNRMPLKEGGGGAAAAADADADTAAAEAIGWEHIVINSSFLSTSMTYPNI